MITCYKIISFKGKNQLIKKMARYHNKTKDNDLRLKIQKKIRKNPSILSQHSLKRFFHILIQQCKPKNLVIQSFKKTSYWNILHFISITVFCILMSAPFLLVPQHNAIQNSEYWYEAIVAINFSQTLVTALVTMMECKILFNRKGFMSLRTFGIVYGTSVMSQLLFLFSYYAVFVVYLHYNPPMPFSGVVMFPSYYLSLTALWFSLPHEKRVKKEQRKQYKVYVAYKILNHTVLTVIQALLIMILKKMSQDFQWVIAFGQPISREIFTWLRRKLLHVAFEETRSNVVELVKTNMNYASSISMALATFATKETGYVILSVDFVMNIWTTITIVRNHKKINPKLVSKDELTKNLQRSLSELALVEIIEFVVPMIYVVTLVIAMYGPNASLFGNYGNGYWDFRPIQSLDKHLLAAFEMFSVDCCSFVLGSFILWMSCSINFSRKICQQMQKYWLFIALSMTQGIVSVCIIHVI